MAEMRDFMISKTRVKLLKVFFLHTEDMFYVRQVSRMIKGEINAVRRELERMLGCGMLKSESRGNRIYYLANKKYPYYQEIQQMVAKETGLGKKIEKELKQTR